MLVAGAALRFATLDAQSLWYDEAVTAHLMTLCLPDLWRAIPDSESTPPLYYVLEWLWTHVFGTGEVGLRSLSALLGTATIGVVWALGRRLGGERAGLAAAALVAFNPMLVWFSQEARGYALLALLGALSALLWLRALEQLQELREATGRTKREAERKQHDRGKLLARERPSSCCSTPAPSGARPFARHRGSGSAARGPPYGDGVVTGYGLVNGRRVFVFCQDFTCSAARWARPRRRRSAR